MHQAARWITPLIVVHIVLLLLAATNFSIITSWTARQPFEAQLYAYQHQNGFGYVYQSAYPLKTVIAYDAAYLFGLAAYCGMWRAGWTVIGGMGFVLCGVGLASFLLESSHWLVDHHRSLIASVPAAALVLAIVAIAQLARTNAS